MFWKSAAKKRRRWSGSSHNNSPDDTRTMDSALLEIEGVRHRKHTPEGNSHKHHSQSLLPTTTTTTTTHHQQQHHRLARGSPRQHRPYWWKPQKWSFATLFLLTLGVSCAATLSIMGAFWWWAAALPTKSLATTQRWFQWWHDRRNTRTFAPRVYYYYYLHPSPSSSLQPPPDAWPAPTTRFSNVTDGTMWHSLQLDDGKDDDWQPIDYTTSRCQPRAAWQTMSFPTCNSLHEVSLHAIAAATAPTDSEDLQLLGQGWFRSTWRLDRTVAADQQEESVVLKTLRLEREYKREYYELHRRDAVAMERLTRSPFVVNVYGMCGNSALNELADFPFAGVQSLEVFNRRMRGQDSPEVQKIKLRMAASIAVGLADVHSVDDSEVPTLAHYDLNPRNVALFRGGRPKLNDFNIAEFLHYDPATNETCGFPSRLHEPWWRAPEEMYRTDPPRKINEKVDVYALGNLLFHTLTTHSPRGKMVPSRVDETRSIVSQGIPPAIYMPYANATDPTSVAIRKAMELCFIKDPEKRASAQDISDILMDALLNVTMDAESDSDLPPPEADQEEDEDSSGGDAVEDKG